MKNRLKAILLATGLTVSMLCTGAFAEEDSTEAVTEVTTEAAAVEAESEQEEAAEVSAVPGTVTGDGKYAAYYDSIKASIPQALEELSSMTPEQVQDIIDNGTSNVEIGMAMNWQGVMDELGNFVEVVSQDVNEEKDVITVDSVAKYDGVDDRTTVDVIYTYDVKNSSIQMEWTVNYTFGKLMQQAALNTIMGIGIVFFVLLFLSWLIGQLHWIPDLLNKRGKEKKAPNAVAAPAPAPVAVEEEEDLTDDLELVAVISAAIAASENAPADGFVVRTIKKANRRKWQNA